ncbi:hypothetical protein [uncultured Methylobacterium sp.]|jgi:hypothetical protein|uniref:hypothetical protein n=1 Tax=uncultured Methylobacterium sp. TaxID=157278 RepID=UPI002605B774|nr:hypothetical protein [uncultured Methylobacterium sp.]
MRRILLAALFAAAGPAHATAIGEAFTPILVAVTLSPKAADRLNRSRDPVQVTAYYSFRPPFRIARTLPEGEIPLGRETVPIRSDSARARLVGDGYTPDTIDPLMAGQRRVLVNVYSGRDGGPLNVLDCGIFEGTLREAAARPIPIECRLIGEE